MNSIASPWESAAGRDNAHAIRARFAAAFNAIAEIDALGHRLLARMPAEVPGDRIQDLVAVALLRRSVTQFVGIRHLFQQSAVDQAKLGIRAQFETLLATRLLVYGTARHTHPQAVSSERARESRSRYYYVAAERGGIYDRLGAADGAWGHRRVGQRRLQEVRAEAAANLRKLDRYFPVQQKAFGTLRCMIPGKKPQYYDAAPWFSFAFRRRNVASVRKLADAFGYLWHYQVLYSALSGAIHPTGIRHDVTISGSHLEVHHPYMPDAFELLCHWSCGWQMITLGHFIRGYSPGSLSDAQRVHRLVARAIDSLSQDIPAGLL